MLLHQMATISAVRLVSFFKRKDTKKVGFKIAMTGSCTKCVLLSPPALLAQAFEENAHRNAAGGLGEEEEEGRPRQRGNSAGLEYLCCTITVHK